MKKQKTSSEPKIEFFFAFDNKIWTGSTILFIIFSNKININMGLIAWLLIGLIAGAAAKMITPQKEKEGWISSLIIGIVGSIDELIDMVETVFCQVSFVREAMAAPLFRSSGD